MPPMDSRENLDELRERYGMVEVAEILGPILSRHV